MTKAGLAALLAGVVALTLGLWLQWTAFDLIGVGLLALVLAAVDRPGDPAPTGTEGFAGDCGTHVREQRTADGARHGCESTLRRRARSNGDPQTAPR